LIPRLGTFRFVVALLAASCGGKGSAPAARPPDVEAPELGASYASPATWRYHPSERARINAREELGDGRTLLVGARGERWVYDAAGKSLKAAASLAPEDLVAVLKSPEQGYWFIGRSGTNYETREPLGPFVRSSAPFDRLAEVTAAKGTLLGVRFDRRLVRSTDGGASWTATGPEGVSLVDVEMTSDGHALLLGLPERLWESADAGATFKPVAARPKGVLALERDPGSGEVRAVTPLGVERFRPGDAAPLAPVVPASKTSAPELGSPPRGPDAGAIAEGRAVLRASEYLEAEEADPRAHTWRLWRGELDGVLEKSDLDEAKGCRALRLARFGSFTTFACFRGSAENTTQPVELYRSSAPGQKFERESFTPYGSLASFKLALGDGGNLIVSGVCPASATSAGCAPNGVHYRRPARPASAKKNNKKGKLPEIAKPAEIKTKGPHFELGAAATPALVDAALGLAYSVDGRIAYALGRSGKTGQLVLYVSRDGGATFEPEQIDLAGLRDVDYGDGSDGAGVESMTPAEDGAVGIVLSRYRVRMLVVTDESGRLLSAAKPPSDFALMGVAGTRALVVDRERSQVFESLDGGATWETAGRLPIDLCGGDNQCEVPVQCAPEGCVIGHELSRIGWGGQGDEELGSLTPSDVTPKEALERRVQTPLECVLSPAPFKPLPGVRELPQADAAAIGKAAWFAPAQNLATASASVFRGVSGPKSRVESSPLLPPVAKGEAYAFTLVSQIEGAAAIRYLLPSGGERRITGVELAWQNLFENRVTEARLRDAGVYLNGDVAHVAGRYYAAQTDLISIAEGGLYVRVHATPKDQQTTYFVDGTSVAELPPIPWPESARAQGRMEMAHVGNQHLGLLLFGNGAAVVRASRRGAGWTFDAGVTGLANPGAFRLLQDRSITYLDGKAALAVELDDVTGRGGTAQVFGLRAEGDVLETPVLVPTQSDLGRDPEPCGAAERSSSARIVASFLPGTRHPVLISDAVDAPRAMVTGAAVLHGTPARPCVAAFDAEPVVADAGSAQPESALVLLDDLEHAWLFRINRGIGGEGEQVEYRNMSCRFSPTAEVPAELFRMPGTTAPRVQGARTEPRKAGE
jgi:hypothetical protein